MSYLKTEVDGGLIPAQEGGQRSYVDTYSTVETQTLRVEDSGKTIGLIAANGSIINLPTAKVGWKIKFIVTRAFTTTDWVITAPAATINGVVIVNGGTIMPASSETTATLNAGNATVGDWMELECVYGLGGVVQYIVSGNFTNALAVTFA